MGTMSTEASDQGMKTAKIVLEVHAGIIPGTPMDEYTRRWMLTSDEARDPEVYGDAVGAASFYALSLQQPRIVNWVRFEWVWL